MTDNKSKKELEVKVIHCWSAPRSRSTSLLYSFDSRGEDCIGIDEPLYRRWLMESCTGGINAKRPYRNALIHGRPPTNDEEEEEGVGGGEKASEFQWKRELWTLHERLRHAVQTLLLNSRKGKQEEGEIESDSSSSSSSLGLIFCKHMSKHELLFDFHTNQEIFFNNSNSNNNSNKAVEEGDNNQMEVEGETVKLVHCHLLLIRNPISVISSWLASSTGIGIPLEEVGIVNLMSIYSRAQATAASSKVAILDSDALVHHPQSILQHLCEHDFNIPFKSSMLTWSRGPRHCDGPWASWWYHTVHNSIGWQNKNKSSSSSPKYPTIHPQHIMLLRASLPTYQFLRSLTHNYHSPIPSLASKTIYEDARNEHLLVWISSSSSSSTTNHLLPRNMASISPWDSSVQGGDGVWEGIRLYNGKLFQLDQHLHRLFQSAKALGYQNIHSRDQILHAIFSTLIANQMTHGAHIRLTLTRGEKYTSSMNPKFNIYGTTLIVLPEWKPTEGVTTYDNSKGIKLITSSIRRNGPSTIDSKIHHNNMINNILPKIQANLANVQDAIMLDMDGFVSETNATNLFMVSYDHGYHNTTDDDAIPKEKKCTLLTPHADYCLPGITRGNVLSLAREELQIRTEVRRISLSEFHTADEVFTTGTMGALTPVVEIDGRIIGCGKRGPITELLQKTYMEWTMRDDMSTKIPSF